MNKKFTCSLLIAAIILQLLFPCYAITKATAAKKNSDIYKIELDSISYYEGNFQQYYISFSLSNYDLPFYYQDGEKVAKKYAVFTKSNARASIEFTDEKPTGNNFAYVKSYPLFSEYNAYKKHRKIPQVHSMYLYKSPSDSLQGESKSGDFNTVITFDDGTSFKSNQINDIYLEVKVANGFMSICEYYVDGLPLDEYVENIRANAPNENAG